MLRRRPSPQISPFLLGVPGKRMEIPKKNFLLKFYLSFIGCVIPRVVIFFPPPIHCTSALIADHGIHKRLCFFVDKSVFSMVRRSTPRIFMCALLSQIQTTQITFALVIHVHLIHMKTHDTLAFFSD